MCYVLFAECGWQAASFCVRLCSGNLGPFRVLGPSETMQVSYKKSFALTPFEFWWASGIFGGLSGSQAGREEEEVTSVHICVYIMINVHIYA